MQQSIWDKLGVWLLGLFVRWSFKVLSGVLVTLGIQKEQWEMWVGAAITFIVGALLTKLQNAYLKKLDPNK